MITQKRWLFRSSYRGKLQPNFEKKMKTLLESKMNLEERSKASTTGYRRNEYLVINLVTIGKLFLKCILGLLWNYLNVIVVVLGIVLSRAMFYTSLPLGRLGNHSLPFATLNKVTIIISNVVLFCTKSDFYEIHTTS